jgi:hypothetical protein
MGHNFSSGPLTLILSSVELSETPMVDVKENVNMFAMKVQAQFAAE